MAYCSKCGNQIPDNTKFCSECGAPTTSATASDSERKQEYAGKVIKCPNCGAILSTFEVNCPACGCEIRDVKGAISVHELSLRLEEIDATKDYVPTRINKKKLKSSERISIQQEIDEKAANQKATLIRTFPIPAAKEDLYEFLVLASSNISMKIGEGSNDEKVSDAWEAKFEQAYEKAKLSFGHTQDFEKIQALYQGKENKVKQRKKKSAYFWIGVLAFFLIPIVLLVINPPSTDPVDVGENERLKVIAEEAYEALADENYALARAKAASLVYSELHASYEKQWDKTRKELLALIDAAENGAEVDIPETAKSSSITEQTKGSEQSVSAADMEIPADFISGYKEAEYSKYNSPASENGLSGSLIYIEGTLSKTEIIDTDGTPSIFGYLTDADDNTWLVMLNCVPIVTETHFDAAIGKDVVCTVVYDGYSGTYNLPFAILNELMILENGTVFSGVQKLLDE